jgi:NADPH:quinone reductase-like Zn-dependent oxidoreductase
MTKETSVIGMTLFASEEEDFKMIYNHLSQLIKANRLKPIVGKVYKLEEAANAHFDVINKTETTGRLTLKID